MMTETEKALPDDSALIQRILAGDHTAAAVLAERHRNAVFAAAYQALGNRDDASDVTQEALIYAHQRLVTLRDRKSYSAWLRHITLSLCVDYRRHRKTRRLGNSLTPLNEHAEEKDYAHSIVVRQAVANLSGAHRTTILLHYIGGWSLEETAALQTIPVNTVRSRLMAAKRLLRNDLQTLFPTIQRTATKSMSRTIVSLLNLSEPYRALLEATFPGAQIQSVETDIEAWQPFGPRVHLTLASGEEKTVDFRNDITTERSLLVPSLTRLGIPGPRILSDTVLTGKGYLTLCEKTRGENLTLWTLGGTPHRIRLATERAFEGIDRLQGITQKLLADPVGALTPHRTLTDEAAILTDSDRWDADWWLAEEGKAREAWLRDPWFAAALRRVQEAVRDITDPLVYTDYTFFFPQNYRIQPGSAEEQENPLVEFTYPFGHFGDSLLGLAMVWVYDCYPFVHTGFVEQFLWRRGVSHREFAPRLGLKALQMVARDLPVTRPAEGGDYWDRLRGWVEQALLWM